MHFHLEALQLLTWHFEHNLSLRGEVALLLFCFAPITACILLCYSRDGIAVSRERVPVVWCGGSVGCVPVPEVGPCKGEVGCHSAVKKYTLADEDFWSRRPHRHDGYRKICKGRHASLRRPLQDILLCLGSQPHKLLGKNAWQLGCNDWFFVKTIRFIS